MFGISKKHSASSQALLADQNTGVSNRKRHTPEDHDKSRFSGVAKRLCRSASRHLRELIPASGNSRSSIPTRLENIPVSSHALRTVHFSSTPAAQAHKEFPFQVTHTFSSGLDASNKAPTLLSLLPQLAGSLSNKQGFVYILDEGRPSPVAEFVESLKNAGAVDLGNGCQLIGAYSPPPEQQSVFSPLWTFQIYDSNLEATFEVPVTEVPFKNLLDPNNRTEQLIHLKNCMDTHLRALPDAFKDSTECPSIICPELPRLAQLLTAQEECLGLQYRGVLNCRESIDWICAAEELLKTISPENPSFRGEESCDFESFFRRTGVHHIGLNPLPFSIGHMNAIQREGAVIRAYKRHLPTNQSTPAHTASMQPPNTASSSGTSSPDWLQARDIGRAYKEPSKQMQCASQAVNGVFQQHAVTPEHVAKHIAHHRIDMLDELGIPLNEQKGLMHPRVISAILNGETLNISKHEFFGNEPDELDIANEQTHRQSWQELINVSPHIAGRNWVEHGRELHAISELRITPEMWLSAQRGTETHELLSLLNNQLQTNSKTHLPAAMVHWTVADRRNEIQQIEQHARRAISNQKDFPIVIRSGGISGHYQTIVPDSKGNWLSLNSDATVQTGVQACNRWCAAGGLAASFEQHGVTDILIPDQSHS